MRGRVRAALGAARRGALSHKSMRTTRPRRGLACVAWSRLEWDAPRRRSSFSGQGLRVRDARGRRGNAGRARRWACSRSDLHSEGVRVGTLARAGAERTDHTVLAHTLERPDGPAARGCPRRGHAVPAPPEPPPARARAAGGVRPPSPWQRAKERGRASRALEHGSPPLARCASLTRCRALVRGASATPRPPGPTMPRKQRFPPEPDTSPDAGRTIVSPPRPSAPAPKSRPDRAEAPTIPPPKAAPDQRLSRAPSEANRTSPPPPERAGDGVDGRPSGVRSRRPARPSTPAATVDEVVADLSKDPRRERDDDE